MATWRTWRGSSERPWNETVDIKVELFPREMQHSRSSFEHTSFKHHSSNTKPSCHLQTNHLPLVYSSPSQNVPVVPGTVHQLQSPHGRGQPCRGLRKGKPPCECGQHHRRRSQVQQLQIQRSERSIQQVGVLVPSPRAKLPRAFCWRRPELRLAEHHRQVNNCPTRVGVGVLCVMYKGRGTVLATEEAVGGRGAGHLGRRCWTPRETKWLAIEI